MARVRCESCLLLECQFSKTIFLIGQREYMNGQRTRSDLKLGYTNGRTALRLVADFSNHWGLREKTYGYQSARIKVPYKQGADFWVHLSLIAQPRTRSSGFESPPGIRHHEDDGTFCFDIADRKLTVIVPLNRPDLWGTVKGKTTPLLFIDRSMNTNPLCAWKDGICLDLRVWITTEANRPAVPSQYENGDGNTMSGGQFESNRRKH